MFDFNNFKDFLGGDGTSDSDESMHNMFGIEQDSETDELSAIDDSILESWYAEDVDSYDDDIDDDIDDDDIDDDIDDDDIDDDDIDDDIDDDDIDDDELSVSDKAINDLLMRASGIERPSKKALSHNISFSGTKICATRHGCKGATNCDYAYGAPVGR